MNEEINTFFKSAFFEWSSISLTIKFYIDKNELKIILTKLISFNLIKVEIKSKNFHMLKKLNTQDSIKLNYKFNNEDQLTFIKDFLKNLYIKIENTKEIIVDKITIYYESKFKNIADEILDYCKSNSFIKFKTEKVHANQIVFWGGIPG